MCSWPVLCLGAATTDEIFTTDGIFSNPQSVSDETEGGEEHEARAGALNAAGNHEERLAGIGAPAAALGIWRRGTGYGARVR